MEGTILSENPRIRFREIYWQGICELLSLISAWEGIAFRVPAELVRHFTVYSQSRIFVYILMLYVIASNSFEISLFPVEEKNQRERPKMYTIHNVYIIYSIQKII